jgi:hypothetical protein
MQLKTAGVWIATSAILLGLACSRQQNTSDAAYQDSVRR